MEFWGAACSNHLPVHRRTGVILVISIAISLAATIGPSSALLLIPRLAYWPAGSTDIWLNATFQDIWPDRSVIETHETLGDSSLLMLARTDSSLVSDSCHTWNPVAYDPTCPSSDWQAIQKDLELTASSVPPGEAFDEITYSAPPSVDIAGRSSLRQMSMTTSTTYEVVDGRVNILLESQIASSQQAAVADALTTTGILWGVAMVGTSTKGHGSVLSHLDAVHTITSGYYQPYTSVVCKDDAIDGPGDIDTVGFPAFPGADSQLKTDLLDGQVSQAQSNLTFANLTKADIFNTPGPLSEYRLSWFDVPFEGIAVGAVILMPRLPQNTTQDILTCSIGAGWGLSTINYTSSINANTTPLLSQVDIKAATNASQSEGIAKDPYAPGSSLEENLNHQRTVLYYPPVFPQRPVVVTEDWARYLNPSIEYLNTTVFGILMGLNATLYITEQYRAETILTAMVANGLSRIGSTSQLQGSVKTITEPDQSIGLDGNYWFAGKGNNVFQVDPDESKDWVKFRVSSTVQGYAYNTHGTTIRLAIGLLLIYCFVSLAHIIYAGISGISSTCWDSIGEVTALAMNSTPTAALRNTCAGITELSIFKLPVRVLAFRDAEGDGEHLELVFGDLDEKTLENKTIKTNRAYGTMPNMDAHDKVA